MAKQYYKKAIEILKNLGFIGGNVNPCLYIKKSAKGIVYIAFYVDSYLMVGDIKAINNDINNDTQGHGRSAALLVMGNKILRK